jgi:hypothetical protein
MGLPNKDEVKGKFHQAKGLNYYCRDRNSRGSFPLEPGFVVALSSRVEELDDSGRICPGFYQ